MARLVILKIRNAELCSHVGQGSKFAPEDRAAALLSPRRTRGIHTLPGMVALGEGIVEAEGGLPCQLSPASHVKVAMLSARKDGHSFGNGEIDRSNPLGIEGRTHKLPVPPVARALT